MATLRNQLVGVGSLLALATVLPMAAAKDASPVGSTNSTVPVQVQTPSMPLKDIVIMKALDSSLKVSFKEVPLKEVLDYLEEKTKGDLNFIFDEVTLKEAEIDVKQLQNDPVMNKDYKKMKVRTFLRMIMSERKMGYYIEDGSVFITTKAQADKKLMVKTYPVNNLLGVPVGTKLTELPKRTQQTIKKAADALEADVTGNVVPEYWRASGGPGQFRFGPTYPWMAVTASLEMHYLLMASGTLDNKESKTWCPIQPKGKKAAAVVKIYDIAGLVYPRNPERSQTEIKNALNLMLGKNNLSASSVVFLTHAEIMVVRQPMAVQQQIESLIEGMRRMRPVGRPLPALDLSGIDLDAIRR